MDFSYRDKENISNLIYQKQGIFMYGDEDFKRELGSVYAGDLVKHKLENYMEISIHY